MIWVFVVAGIGAVVVGTTCAWSVWVVSQAEAEASKCAEEERNRVIQFTQEATKTAISEIDKGGDPTKVLEAYGDKLKSEYPEFEGNVPSTALLDKNVTESVETELKTTKRHSLKTLAIVTAAVTVFCLITCTTIYQFTKTADQPAGQGEIQTTNQFANPVFQPTQGIQP